MADGWYPPAIVDKGNDAGTYTDEGEPKGLLHTTEGKTYSGARSAYVANNSWPHATCSFETGTFQIWQHNSVHVASRALRNESGGVETNRDNVVQLEIVGTADRNNAASWGSQYVENFSTAYLNGIGDWMAWVNEIKGVPNQCTVTFKTYPESYGNNGVRLSGSAWDAYSGWLGHMHAPENTHGDPGLIDIAYLLDRAGGEEDDMTPEEHEWLRQLRVACVPYAQDAQASDTRFQVQALLARVLEPTVDEATLRAVVSEYVETLPARDEYLRPQDGEDTVRKALLALARRGTSASATTADEGLKFRLDAIETKLDQLLAP